MGGAIGLDYLAVDKVAGILGIRLDRPMLESIQALEAAQLDRWRKTRANNGEGDRDDG